MGTIRAKSIRDRRCHRTMSMVEHAYLQIKIDGVDITQPYPDYVMNFRYEKKTTCDGNKFYFTVYDEMAMQIEAMLLKGAHNVEISYGMTASTSKAYTAEVLDWTPTLAGWGAKLDIWGITKALKKSNTGAKKIYQGSASEVFTIVANEEGWTIGAVEPTRETPFTDPGTGSLTPKIWERRGMTAAKFISEKVLPYAVSKKTGKSGYKFYFEDKDGTVNFHTPDFKKGEVKTHLDFVVGAEDSNVLEWQPQYSGATLLSSSSMLVEYQDEKGTLQKLLHGDASADSTTNPFSNGPERKVVRARSREEALALANYMWELKLQNVYKGKLTIVNEPNVLPFDVISILALTKNNVPHHSSGLYQVLNVTDSIEGGLIKSEMEVLGVKA